MPDTLSVAVLCAHLHALQARDEYRRGQRVIARTPRGIELGEVLCEATPEAISYLKDPPVGNVQRLATVQDDHERCELPDWLAMSS